MVVTFSDSLGDTPAKVNRETGEIFLNSNVWDTLPPAYQAFILEHETGHYKLQTTNELEADHYAFNQLAGKSYESLKNTVRVLGEVLPYTTPEHGLRLLNIYRLSLGFDYDKQPTPDRLNEIREIEAHILKNYSNNPEFMEYYTAAKDRGTAKDYEFPGYDPQTFAPSVGQYFRDVSIETNANQVNWPSMGQSQPIAVQTDPVMMKTATATNAGVVPLEIVPDFEVMEIDWKSVLIGILIAFAIYGLSKM